jgi:hypothetical protein
MNFFFNSTTYFSKRLLLFSILFLFYLNEFFAAGGPCQVPFTPCWCAQNPQPCANQPGVPINNELWVLVVAGLIYGIYFIKKSKSKVIKE